jgi:hypothetical protein
LAAISLDFVGSGVTAQSTGPGTVQVNVPMINDYGRVSLENNQNCVTPGIYQVNFEYIWLDPLNRWDNIGKWWLLPAGVYEIGTNITAFNNPAEYSIRLYNASTGQPFAIANSISHLIGDLEHTTHLSTIVQFVDPTRIQVLVDAPYHTGFTISAQYTGYAATDNITGIRLLTDFWYHKLS